MTTLNIKHNIYDKKRDEKGRWFIGTTKTSSGKRQVHISATLLKALKNYKKKQNYLLDHYCLAGFRNGFDRNRTANQT